MLIDVIVGARPNFMKVAPILRVLDARRAAGSRLRYRLVHTGQHYDSAMCGTFFEQLGIPRPDVNLGIGSGTQAEQTGGIMVGYEALLGRLAPALCLVVGDVNSTMACAIAARKMNVPVAHVEAGIRSGDPTMPEEINRIVTDALTDWFFTTTAEAGALLQQTGVDAGRIFFVGNTMIDTLLCHLDDLRPPDFAGHHGLEPGGYLVCTLHRPGNVDDEAGFVRRLRKAALAAQGQPLVFPAHPRTAKALSRASHLPENFLPLPPQPYFEFIWLVKNARAVLTDSGGITEEATVLGVPCLTLRDTTERPETLRIGTNELIGTDPRAIAPALQRVFSGAWKTGGIPEKWDGRAAQRIVSALEKILDVRVAA